MAPGTVSGTVTNISRQQTGSVAGIFFVALDFFCLLITPVRHRLTLVTTRRKLYECLSMISDIDEVPDTPHVICLTYKAALGRSCPPALLVDTRPLPGTRLAPSRSLPV